MAFIAQDTRGHYGSEGAAVPFEHEASDGYDTCEWIVRQAWSDGTIAVFGESYVGVTAIATAASGHPAIRAAALRATSSDIATDWLRHQDVLRLEFVIRWSLAAWSGRDILAPELDWTIRPLSAIVPAVAPERVPDVLDSWARGAGPRTFWTDDAGWPVTDRSAGRADTLHGRLVGPIPARRAARLGASHGGRTGRQPPRDRGDRSRRARLVRRTDAGSTRGLRGARGQDARQSLARRSPSSASTCWASEDQPVADPGDVDADSRRTAERRLLAATRRRGAAPVPGRRGTRASRSRGRRARHPTRPHPAGGPVAARPEAPCAEPRRGGCRRLVPPPGRTESRKFATTSSPSPRTPRATRSTLPVRSRPSWRCERRTQAGTSW